MPPRGPQRAAIAFRRRAATTLRRRVPARQTTSRWLRRHGDNGLAGLGLAAGAGPARPLLARAGAPRDSVPSMLWMHQASNAAHRQWRNETGPPLRPR